MLITVTGDTQVVTSDQTSGTIIDLASEVGRLRAAGVADPEGDVDVLVRHVLGTDSRSASCIDFGDRVEVFRGLIERRTHRIPLAHLTGTTRFRGLDLSVGENVFVPQPETGSLIDWVVAAATPAPTIVDLCTGAGTVALSLAHEIPDAVVHAVEKDGLAAAWTRRNAQARSAAGDPTTQVHEADIKACLQDMNGGFDIVVSNPPYVATTEAHIPAPEVLDHDPGVALWAGADGLDIIRLVENTAARLLRTGGLLAVEHSDRQKDAALQVFRETGLWEDVEDHADYDGLDRFVTARRNTSPDPRQQ